MFLKHIMRASLQYEYTNYQWIIEIYIGLLCHDKADSPRSGKMYCFSQIEQDCKFPNSLAHILYLLKHHEEQCCHLMVPRPNQVDPPNMLLRTYLQGPAVGQIILIILRCEPSLCDECKNLYVLALCVATATAAKHWGSRCLGASCSRCGHGKAL